MEKYLLIDGSAVIHRAYHALPLFNAQNGTPTNALYGFIKMLLSLTKRIEPNYFSVVYDTPVRTFRKELLSSYQSQRPPTPEEFKVQLPLTQKFLQKAGVKYYLKEGFEADDVIATIANKVKNRDNLHLYILTGDKDILQLVNERVTVIMPRTGASDLNYLDPEGVKKRLGVSPERVVDYKALVGDPSDNYPGVRGIGPKTAIKLLEKYGGVAALYEQLDQLDQKTAQLLRQNKENALLCTKLAKLVSNVELPFTLEEASFEGFTPKAELIKFCEEYTLSSIKHQLSKLKTFSVQEEAGAVDKTDDNQLSFF
jgi:DNA polymerase-1